MKVNAHKSIWLPLCPDQGALFTSTRRFHQHLVTAFTIDSSGSEIMKADKLGRQGSSGSQEQPRMEIIKGDKRRETKRRQWQPRGRQMKGDKAATASQKDWGSATQSFRGKNPYSFQLSGEKAFFWYRDSSCGFPPLK